MRYTNWLMEPVKMLAGAITGMPHDFHGRKIVAVVMR